MNFSDIPGQVEIISKLIKSVREERVSHAQLFTGPEGCASLALAVAYARYVGCENRTAADSCGVCKSCVKHDKMIHPDLHFVFPVVKKKSTEDTVSDHYIEEWREFARKNPFFTVNRWLDFIEAGNSQGMIFAAEASEIIRKLNLKSFESDFKIMIIWLPERMHPSASNKLLKMIEEPPEKTLFLLVSDEADKLPSTIISRCQLIKIPSFTNEDIKSYLRNVFGLTENKATDIARVACGNIIKAGELSSEDETRGLNLENFRLLMRFAWKRDVIGSIGWAEEMSSLGREAQKNFLSYSLRLLRENLMLSLDQLQNRLVFLAGEEAEFSAKFHPFISRDNVYRLSDEFSLAFSHIEANGYAKAVFLDLALKVTGLIR